MRYESVCFLEEVCQMGKVTEYHGSYTEVTTPQIIKTKNTKDFGPGFYCTIIREQAERWSKRYDTPILNVYTVRMNTCLKIYRSQSLGHRQSLQTPDSRNRQRKKSSHSGCTLRSIPLLRQ